MNVPSPLQGRRLFLVGAISALALGARRAVAAEPDVPASLRLAILLKVLGYDRALAENGRETVRIGVVFEEGDRTSRRDRDAVLTAFAASQKKVAAKEADMEAVAVPALARRAKDFDVLYACSGVGIEPLLAAVDGKRRPLFAPNREAVEAGAVLGVVAKDGKPKLLINVSASIEAGMELDPQILRLAELVRPR